MALESGWLEKAFTEIHENEQARKTTAKLLQNYIQSSEVETKDIPGLKRLLEKLLKGGVVHI